MEVQNSQDTDHNPLVSIIVITYNSAKFVLETLESAKAQTYQNIELIVSDDWSTDNTIEICKQWIQNNKVRFRKTIIVTSKINTGTSSNCNRGFNESTGEWIKFIAGDDILHINSIEYFIEYLNNNFSSPQVVFSKQCNFIDNDTNTRTFTETLPRTNDNPLFIDNSSAKDQLQVLLFGRINIPGPTLLIKSSLLEDIGRFDEKYGILEDFPLYIKILESNVKFYFLDKTTVYYRIHSLSVTKFDKNEVIITKFDQLWWKFHFDVISSKVTTVRKWNIIYRYYLTKTMILLGNKNHILRYIYILALKAQPLSIYNKLSHSYGK